MSRRRKSLPYPKRQKDATQRRLRFVCTHGGSTHVQFLREYKERVVPGQPDFGGVMRTIDAASVQTSCRTAPHVVEPGFPWTGKALSLFAESSMSWPSLAFACCGLMSPPAACSE